jgi:hypothetical protein
MKSLENPLSQGFIAGTSTNDFVAYRVTFQNTKYPSYFYTYFFESDPKEKTTFIMDPKLGIYNSNNIQITAPVIKYIGVSHAFSDNPDKKWLILDTEFANKNGINTFLSGAHMRLFKNLYLFSLEPNFKDCLYERDPYQFDIFRVILNNFSKFEEWAKIAREKNPPPFTKRLPSGEGNFTWDNGIAYLKPYPKGFEIPYDQLAVNNIASFSEDDVIGIVTALCFYPSAKKQIQERLAEYLNKRSQSKNLINDSFK